MTEQEQIFAYKELRNNGQAFVIDNYEDADRIIEALEKQIPKKPIIKTNAYNKKFYECPNCRIDIEDVIFSPYKYCRKCGQHIDWGNEDDRAG